MEYSLGQDQQGRLRHITRVTDANGNSKITYKDSRELITTLKEFVKDKDGAQQTLWTFYDYDQLKQITKVTDAKGNLTEAGYDLLGRRTVLSNKDTGKTEMVYDNAGNLIKKITANLREQSKAINYAYYFNRLTNISYPNYPGNNVTYIW